VTAVCALWPVAIGFFAPSRLLRLLFELLFYTGSFVKSEDFFSSQNPIRVGNSHIFDCIPLGIFSRHFFLVECSPPSFFSFAIRDANDKRLPCSPQKDIASEVLCPFSVRTDLNSPVEEGISSSLFPSMGDPPSCYRFTPPIREGNSYSLGHDFSCPAGVNPSSSSITTALCAQFQDYVVKSS